MMALPFDIGTLHFIGIGGIGMSGIAEILHNLGYRVQGSDAAENANVQRLRDMGVEVQIGQCADNLGEARVAVVSSAIKAGNPELTAARERFIPVVPRAEMLGELMRLKWSVAVGGTHGKTTTTSLIAAVLEAADYDPTVINGGIINAYGTNARLGDGDWMVVEADESDGSFVKLPATVAVITNIDPEHMEFYGSEEALHDAFEAFVENIPFYGFAVLCLDHPAVQGLIGRIEDRRVVTYGFNPQADVRAVNLSIEPARARFDVEIAGHRGSAPRSITGLSLPMVGRHNVQNAVSAVAVASEMGIGDEVLKAGLAGFSGVKRRFTKTGEAGGITVIDDYAHHPVEIAAVLQAARQAVRQAAGAKVIAVVQPHRYTRLADLFDGFCTCFNDADRVVVADVYTAGETPIAGADRDSLVEGLRSRGHRHADALADPAQLAAMIADMAEAGDLVVCLGAGDITAWANALPGQLKSALAARDGGEPGAAS